DEDRLEVPLVDRAIHVRVDEVQSGRRAPVSEEPWLHMLRAQRLAQKRVVEKVDLTDREVIRGSPVRVDATQLLARQRSDRLGARFRRHIAPPSVRTAPRTGTATLAGCGIACSF